MVSHNKKHAKQHKLKKLSTRIVGSLSLLILAAAAFFITQITFSASTGTLLPKIPRQTDKPIVSAAPASTPPSRTPPQTQAQRIKITIGETGDVPFPAEI